ncbi:MAG TPA: DUF3606 domain-containing protein [Chryseolinea sp.]|nr:DUF3606 domain-containing protein [Chryseolinea sp.]
MNEVKLHEEEVDRIHMEENYEVQAWCALFGITIRELRRAIDAVGPSAVKVKYYLKEHNVHTVNPLV